MTPEENERLYQLQMRAANGQLDEDESRELIRLRRKFRKQVEQANALQKFREAPRAWRVSFQNHQDDCFPFYTLSKLTAEREMALWGLGELLTLEQIDSNCVMEKLRFDAGSDCYYIDRQDDFYSLG